MYVKVKNGLVETFPYGIRELMQDNPNTSFPDKVSDEFLEQYNIYPVRPTEIPQPFNNITQNAAPSDPILLKGKWIQDWKITNATDEEVEQRLGDLKQNARATRNQLLAETDWMALSDVTMTAEMAAYRQALRDITSQAGYPTNIVWPTKPA